MSLIDQFRAHLYGEAAVQLRQLAWEVEQRAVWTAGWPLTAIGQGPALDAIGEQLLVVVGRLETAAAELRQAARACDRFVDELSWSP